MADGGDFPTRRRRVLCGTNRGNRTRGFGYVAEHTGATRKLPERVIQFRLLLAHYGIYALTNVVLLTINALTSPGEWWFLWVVWGWGIVFAAHAGFFVRGLAGAHVMIFLVGGAGIVVIDLVYSDQRWFYWVLLPWALILTLHVLFSSSLRRRYFEWEQTLASD